MKARPYFVVRTGREIGCDNAARWRTIVHCCRLPDGVDRYRVCLHGECSTKLIEGFDVHCGRYAGEAEEDRVKLSASGSACYVAAQIERYSMLQICTLAGR